MPGSFFGRLYSRRPSAAASSSTSARPALVVLLHGLGDTGAGWAGCGLDREPGLEHVTFLYPTAPVRPVTLNMGMPMPAWFDLNSLDIETMVEDERGMREAADALHDLIEEEKVDKDRVVVAGFSQGGAVALLAATQDRGREYAGVVGLSTFLPLVSEMRNGNACAAGRIKPKKALICHGDVDEMVRPRYHEMTVSALRAELGMGNELTSEVFPGMGHSSCPDELERIANWLKATLPP